MDLAGVKNFSFMQTKYQVLLIIASKIGGHDCSPAEMEKSADGARHNLFPYVLFLLFLGNLG